MRFDCYDADYYLHLGGNLVIVIKYLDKSWMHSACVCVRAPAVHYRQNQSEQHVAETNIIHYFEYLQTVQSVLEMYNVFVHTF